MTDTLEERVAKLEQEVRDIRRSLTEPVASPPVLNSLASKVAAIEERLRDLEE